MLRKTALALVAAGVGALALAAPASAHTGGVDPIVDCVQSKSSTSVKLVWGYDNTNKVPVAPNAYWQDNAKNYSVTLPKTFAVGEHHAVGVATVKRAEYDSWGLSLPTCSDAGVSLPAGGNGLAVGAGVVLLGAVGAVVVRRSSS
jgi:hypothetical protein